MRELKMTKEEITLIHTYLNQQGDARESHANLLGTADTDLLVPVVNPTFRGGPQLPSFRQAWRKVRRNSGTLILSDGLSDPFQDEPWPNTGFGIELLVETTDDVAQNVQDSWLFALIYELSQQAAHNGNFHEQLDQHALFSMDITPPEGLEAFADAEGYVGVLMGIPAPEYELDCPTPGGLIRLVTVKLLFPQELDLIIREGRKGREELARLFALNGTNHISSLSRQSVV